MATLLPVPENPFDPEIDTRHAGKVFVLTQGILRAVSATGSDGTDAAELVNRFLLCLWDVDDDTSLWITLQSIGDYLVPHAEKRIYAGIDPNWMDPNRQTFHRDGTLWRLGSSGHPVRFRQQQQRAVTKAELLRIQGRISPKSMSAFV
jgi:hypothetical protein